MPNKRGQYSNAFKAKVALAALNKTNTITELVGLYQISSVQIHKWKAKLAKEAENVFANQYQIQDKNSEKEMDSLYNQIGKQKVEIDWLKKKVGLFGS